MTLSASSIIFHVLAQRIFDKPMIIWEEYRLHAILFTLRCVSVFAYGSLVSTYYPAFYNSMASRVTLAALVLAHHLVVDEVTRRCGPTDPTRTTVRSMGKAEIPIWKRSILKFYSFYQFAALGSHLLPNARLADAGFNTVIAIQSSAFLMTLFRKGLIKNYSHAGWYSFCLLLSIFHIFRFNEFSLWYPFKIMCAFLLRTKLRVNKYFLWVGFCIFSIPTIENYVYNQAAQNLYQGDISTLQEYSIPSLLPSMKAMTGGLTSSISRISINGMLPTQVTKQWKSMSIPTIDFETASQSLKDADRTTMLASAAFIMLTWFFMTSNTNAAVRSSSLRRSVSNTAVGKYFGFDKEEARRTQGKEEQQVAAAIEKSRND